MTYAGKNPELDAVDLDDKTETPSNPPSGQIKVYIKNGKMYILNSAGEEVSVGSSSAVLSAFIS
jgi:hypothetical protein